MAVMKAHKHHHAPPFMASSSFLTLVVASALTACGDNHDQGHAPRPDAGMTPDGGIDDVPLERAHAGGSPTAIKVIGRRAYIGVGPRLAVWDLSTNPPSLITESAPMRGVISAVATAGPHIYAAERQDIDSRIHVFELTTPTTITEVNTFSVAAPGAGSFINDLAVGIGRLYVADQEQGVVELDLQDPAHPTQVHVAPLAGVNTLTVAGSRLYYTTVSFIGGISAGALDLDSELGDLGSSSLGDIKGISFAGKLAVGAGPDGMYVFDMSDPSLPFQRYAWGTPGQGPFARDVAVRGTTAWIPADDGLHILDLSNPNRIDHTGPLPAETANVNAVSASAEALAFVTDRGRLVSLDLTTTHPEPRQADVTLCADCVGVSSANGNIYIADIVGGIRTASLSSLSDLGRSVPLAVVPYTGGLQFVFEDVDVSSNHAYVADWLHGLRIFDLATPQSQLTGSLVTGGAPSAVRVVGTRAYVAEGTNGGRLRVIDVSNPANPIDLGGTTTSKAMDVEVRGHIAYVADESLFGPGGLRIFNVANPAAVTELSVYNDACNNASDVALLDNLAVVACGSDGFHWVDISNPWSPTRVATTQPAHSPSSAVSVATWDGHAVLGHDRGVIVMSIAPVPTTLASYATAWPVRSISIPYPGRIVAAAGAGGVYQWKL